MFFELALLGCILQIVQAACVIDIETGTQETTKCKTDKCDVTIGGSQYCSQCSKDDDHLIDGKCVGAGQDSANNCETPKTGTCTSCKEGYFLHKGGCYKVDQQPGSAMCAATTTAGVCTQGAEGYFAVPGATKTDQSVVACSDATTGVTIGGNKKYVGVDGCTACTAEGLTANAGGTAKCTACTSGKKPNAAGSSCYTCPDEGETAGCSNCSDNGKCEACVPGKILKTSGSTKTCVAEAECTAGFFVSTASNVKTCISCTDNLNGVPDCATCEARADDKAKAKCLSCTGTKKPKVDGTQCNECDIPGCTNCDAASQCAVCGDGYRHDANTCQKCTPENCKACTNDVNTCTACVEGYTLEGGKCASSSTNKSGLSTGAIAGISVAAVVVVGGLVGFLCWWFVCRGKA
ncbi:Variant-specific surface protein [Giardia duodenalis]|uniref:Variant-specific surface protein n=1 Tax=Giardia intestinalis TaxID=5741 RepID=V6TWY7_GIAIN|nr:Variant-specific surface protein [Giardia intestinalis]